jgi:hypothetical protein
MHPRRLRVVSVLSIALALGTGSIAGGTSSAGAAAWRTGHQARCAKNPKAHRGGASRGLTARRSGKRRCATVPAKPAAANPVNPEDTAAAAEPVEPAPLHAANPVSGRPPGTQAPAPPAAGTPQAEEAAGAPFRFFSPNSFWNQELPANAELDPSSALLATSLGAEILNSYVTGTAPWIDTTSYSVPIYTVPADQPTVPVQLVSRSPAPALQAAWGAVPIPDDAVPAAGTDASLVLWQPSTDRLWEFWRLVHSSSGWQAAWGGAIQSVSSNPGVYDTTAWSGAKPWWGSSASSLSIAGGLITFEDLARGSIDHALALALPNVRAGVFTPPAQRSDGTSVNPLSVPEGAHLRLDPNLDLASLHLPRLTLMIAKAAQRYGVFVRDRARVTHFFAQDPVSTSTEPYGGKTGYFEGRTPAQLLASFPWTHLQVLKMDLRHSP